MASLRPKHWLNGCDPSPDCVGSRCCATTRVPESGAALTPTPPADAVPETPLNPGVRADMPVDVPIAGRGAVPDVQTGWTTLCDNGLCAEQTSSASMGGGAFGFISPSKTVNTNVMPADTFAARQMFEAGRYGKAAPRTLDAINRDWDTQGINSLRGSPEFQQQVDALRPLLGDAAEAVVTRQMAGADGMSGVYSNSAYFGGDNLARRQFASQVQAAALANRESTRLNDLLGVDPGMFNGQAVLFDSAGNPSTRQLQPDGQFADVVPTNPTQPLDYLDVARANTGGLDTYGKTVDATRKSSAELDKELLKQSASTGRTVLTTQASVNKGAAANTTRLAAVRARLAAAAARNGAGVIRGQRSVEDQQAIDRNREEERRKTVALQLKAKADADKRKAGELPSNIVPF